MLNSPLQKSHTSQKLCACVCVSFLVNMSSYPLLVGLLCWFCVAIQILISARLKDFHAQHIEQ